MKELQLTMGKVALVDDDIYNYLSQWTWRAVPRRDTWYAERQDYSLYPRVKWVGMHQLVCPGAEMVDHKNRNGLDNRRENLRPCTRSQNQANRGPQKNNPFGFKGVSKKRHKYSARIRLHRQNIQIGYFSTPEEAAHAYDQKARELFGEFAWTNFND